MNQLSEALLVRKLLDMQQKASLTIANLEAELLTLRNEHQEQGRQDKARQRLVTAQLRHGEVSCAIRRVAEGSFGYCKLTAKRIDAETLQRNPASRFSREALEMLRMRGFIEDDAL